jgi:hypothetical protein
MTHCEDCFEKDGSIVPGENYGDGCVLCSNCSSDRAEAAYERSMADYYGGDTPQTDREHYEAAAKQKREMR